MTIECRSCGQSMELVAMHDEGAGGEYAYNLYQCQCGVVCKRDVWQNPGVLWIGLDDMVHTSKSGGGFASIRPTNGS